MKCLIGESIINYDVIGEGKAIIFFSGFGNDMTAMKKTMEPIFDGKQTWKRIYVDHLGVGDTVIGDDIENAKDACDAMKLFVDEIMGDKNYVLGGYSFGGYISRYILNKRFDKVDGLFLLTPAMIKEFELFDVDRSIEVIKNVDEHVQNSIDKRIQLDLIDAMKKTNREFQQKLISTSTSIKISLDSFEKCYEKPTLIITGRQDNSVGYRDAYKIIEKYPRATYITMDKCGHAAQFEQSSIFNILVKEWLFRIEEDALRGI